MAALPDTLLPADEALLADMRHAVLACLSQRVAVHRLLEAPEPSDKLRLVVKVKHPKYGDFFHADLTASKSRQPATGSEGGSLSMLLRWAACEGCRETLVQGWPCQGTLYSLCGHCGHGELRGPVGPSTQSTYGWLVRLCSKASFA